MSDILEPMSPALLKYFLSPTALRGILRRADARGKALPTLLRDAIEWMLGWWENPASCVSRSARESQGGGKGLLNQGDRTGALSTLTNQCIALDGDKLKPREDQRKGGNGFGVNEDGAGYTLTGVDRHGVAYCADGEDVASTITRQISEQSGQDNRANAVVVSMAQNTRDEVRIVGGDGQITGALPAEPGMKQQTYVAIAREGADGE